MRRFRVRWLRSAVPHPLVLGDEPAQWGEYSGWMLAGLLFVIDAALILLFALLGNRSHGTGLSPVDIASTAWPFLVGLTVAWLLTRSWSRAAQLWPAGIIIVGITVAVGMVLRVLFTDGGAELSFILVATGTLGVFLLGRRLLTWLLLPCSR
ncbi:DUF3054 domain-containing protein [Nesterenkonia salmonea]|uniref:DUF3054 domain-containing protein n=1 Tax=Nesterenkonia salmonea TaxID=1804987 RepID=A0A5R9B9D2_9MICC|nr:DUF3054 domain-containing protein [Nesterenkonia salmonea]TLP92341.1 DUF3054 domain-containing protein [Nesterenkonia salmonea]